jgi:hypothetical protein
MASASTIHVAHFRQILLWPLRLMAPAGRDEQLAKPWEILQRMGTPAPGVKSTMNTPARQTSFMNGTTTSS